MIPEPGRRSAKAARLNRLASGPVKPREMTRLAAHRHPAPARLEGARLAHTQSICPRCGAVLDAELRERDGSVVLSRVCPDHGRFEAVVYGDAKRYLEIQRFDKPGESPLERQTESVRGCPHDCGICPEHAQHTCLGIIEVNTLSLIHI